MNPPVAHGSQGSQSAHATSGQQLLHHAVSQLQGSQPQGSASASAQGPQGSPSTTTPWACTSAAALASPVASA